MALCSFFPLSLTSHTCPSLLHSFPGSSNFSAHTHSHFLSQFTTNQPPPLSSSKKNTHKPHTLSKSSTTTNHQPPPPHTKVNGLMVYSTCSFNPIENEAVVAELLRRTRGAMELVDVRDHLPALRRMPGLKHWAVRDKTAFYDSWEDAVQQSAYKIDKSMFPGDAATLPLEMCMRFLPHHQDTGGFFVCVLKKVRVIDGGVNLQERSESTRFMGAKSGGKGKGAAGAGVGAGAGAGPAAVEEEGEEEEGGATEGEAAGGAEEGEEELAGAFFWFFLSAFVYVYIN